MIHVDAQPEPGSFDKAVRKKGVAHMKRKDIALDAPLPSGIKINPYWRGCLDDLYSSYRGVCAYLCVHFERVTGGASVDHFIAKSSRADQAYEWANYRLACSTMNSRKREFDDVLDPFVIEDGLFYLEMTTGHIYPNPDAPATVMNQVEATIERLGLDDAGNREIRVRHFQDYVDKCYKSDYLRRISPFVWAEAKRQGLL